MHEDNRKITKYPVWTHLKKEKNLYVKNIYHNPRGGTRLIFLAHAKGFQSTLQRPKKKKCSSLFNDKIKWTRPINYAGCIMSPRHTFTNKQHCWSVNIHYYYADSNVIRLQPHHSLADMPVTDRDPRAHTPSDEAMVTWFCHLHCVRVLKGKKSIVSILYKGLQYLQVTSSGLLKSKLIFFFLKGLI